MTFGLHSDSAERFVRLSFWRRATARPGFRGGCRKRGRNRGAILVEFALGYGVVLLILAEVIEFGYMFYIYNSLETTVRDAARYASVRPYDVTDPNNHGSTWETAVENMAVYGNPDGSGSPIVRGLTTSHVTVTNVGGTLVPEDVTVAINGLTINTFFQQITLSGKPRARFPHLGRISLGS